MKIDFHAFGEISTFWDPLSQKKTGFTMESVCLSVSNIVIVVVVVVVVCDHIFLLLVLSIENTNTNFKKSILRLNVCPEHFIVIICNFAFINATDFCGWKAKFQIEANENSMFGRWWRGGGGVTVNEIDFTYFQNTTRNYAGTFMAWM